MFLRRAVTMISIRLSSLYVTVTLVLVAPNNIKDAEGCNKLVYTSVNQETTVHIPLHNTPGPVNGCDVCPGGIAEIESASVKNQSPDMTADNVAAMYYIFWNNKKNDILLDLPKDPSVLVMPSEEPDTLSDSIQVDVFYSCKHNGFEENLNSTITITLVPVELTLKMDDKDNVKENDDIHFTCVVLFNGTIPDNPRTHIVIKHKSLHLNHCVNKTVCEANVSKATIPTDEGYYTCSAAIDNSLEHWIHISSQPVFVMIEPDKVAYYGKTIGAPIAACVLFIVATIVVASIVMRHWKRVLQHRQEEWEERYRHFNDNRPNAHRNLHQDGRVVGARPRGRQRHSPPPVMVVTSRSDVSSSECEYIEIVGDSNTDRNRSSSARSVRGNMRSLRGSNCDDQVNLLRHSDEEITENV